MIDKFFFLIVFLLGITCNNYCKAVSYESFQKKERKQSIQNFSYVVLDIDRILSNSIAYKEFKNRWTKVNDKYQKEIEFYESQLLKLEKEATKEGVSKQDVIKAKQQIGVYEVKVQKLLRKRKEVLEKAGSEAITILRENINKLVHDYAMENKISIIFAKDQVVYFSNSIDITDFILKKLNSTLSTLKVDI